MSQPMHLLGRLRSLAGRSTPAGGLFLARVYAQIAQFGFFLIVARHMGVADFGTFSLLFACALGLSLIAEGGWREYLICHDDEALVRRAYGLAIIMATGLFLLISAGSGVFWAVGADGGLAPTMMALALWIPLRSLCTLESGRLTKADRIHEISLASLISETIGCVAGVLALWAGLGILALGVSKLALQLSAMLCLMWPQTRVKPEWRRQPHDRAMFNFASQILIGRFAAFLSGNFSVFVIGFGLSTTAVGFYRAATRIAGAAAEALREPARVIFWSTMKKASGEGERQARIESAENSAWYLFCVAAPVFALLTLLAEPLIQILLGDKWLPAAPIMSILAASYLIGFVTTLSEPVFSLDNQPERSRKLALTSAAISGVAIAAAVPFGLLAVAWSQLAGSVVIAAITLWSLRAHGDFASHRLLRRLAAPGFGMLAMATALWFIETRDAVQTLPHIVQLVMLMAIGVGTYVLATGLVILNFFHKRTVIAR